MGCACNKKSGGTLADRKAAEARKASEATGTARTVPGPQPTGTRTTPVMQGGTQSFALQSGDKTGRFGSRLERDAAAARIPGSRPV